MTKRILVFLLVVGMSLCLFPVIQTWAYEYGEKTNSVEIYVGYFGTTYVKVADVSESEMEELGTKENTYSSIDSGNFVRYFQAVGVPFDRLLESIGIAVNDVNEVYFYGTDNDYPAGFSNLFIQRDCYPNLGEGYNQEFPSESDTELIKSKYYEVPTILAFKEYNQRYSDEPFDEAKFKEKMKDENCLRIVFGQTSWNEQNTFDSVKWVYKINVRLKGSPITAEDTEMFYGSDNNSQLLSYDVSTPFEDLTDRISAGLTFTSDHPEIVSVDSDGTLHAHQIGQARITVSYMDGDDVIEATAIVKVSEKLSEEPDDPWNNGGSDIDKNPTDTNTNDTNQNDTNSNGNNPNSAGNKNDPAALVTPSSNLNDPAVQVNPANGVGSGSESGMGGNGSGTGGGATGDGTGSGTLMVGQGSGADTSSTGEGSFDTEGGTDGDDLGAGDSRATEAGDASRNSEGLETAASDEQPGEDVDSEGNTEKGDSAQAVYLSLGNISGGNSTGGSISGSGTSGGSGGKAIELEDWPFRYTIILIATLAALFVVGGTYRSLRFRRETR